MKRPPSYFLVAGIRLDQELERLSGLPVFAGGNADVDIEMLEAATFSVLVNHDDEEREFAYTSAAEASLAKAKTLGWTVVSMKHDWTTVFEDRDEPHD